MRTRILLITLLVVSSVVTAQAATSSYGLFVCGTQVTSSNASDVLGDGTVRYNARANRLILNNATLVNNDARNVSNSVQGTCIATTIPGLTIALNGKNSLTSANVPAIFAGASFMILGDTLSVKGINGIYLYLESPNRTTNGSVVMICSGGARLSVEGTSGSAIDGSYVVASKVKTYYAGSVVLEGANTVFTLKGTNGTFHNVLSVTCNDGIEVKVPTGASFSSAYHVVDGDGAEIKEQTVHLSALSGVPIDEVHFPDATFMSRLVAAPYGEDLFISDAENEGITSLQLLPPNANIRDITGVGFLTHLKSFILHNSGVATADFSHNTLLETISMTSTSSLSSVNLSGCTNLKTLNFNDDALTSLVIPEGASQLRTILVENNRIESLDLTGLSSLTTVKANGCKLSSIVVGALPSLERLDVYNNLLTEIDASNCQSIKYLLAQNNRLNQVNVDNCYELTNLNVENNNLTSLNLKNMMPSYRNHNMLGILNCSHNRITSLDLSDCWLNSVNIHCNQIKLEQMVDLVTLLRTQGRQAQQYSYFYLIKEGDEAEGNEANIQIAKAIYDKNFMPKHYSVDQWVDYDFPTPGDVNSSGLVDVGDVVALANYVMGEQADDFNADAAYVNEDYAIDVGDVVTLAGIVMGQ